MNKEKKIEVVLRPIIWLYMNHKDNCRKLLEDTFKIVCYKRKYVLINLINEIARSGFDGYLDYFFKRVNKCNKLKDMEGAFIESSIFVIVCYCMNVTEITNRLPFEIIHFKLN